MNKYSHIISRLYNTPLLVTPEKLGAITSVVLDAGGTSAIGENLISLVNPESKLHASAQRPEARAPMTMANSPSTTGAEGQPINIAVIPVIGSLVHRARGFSGSGMRSYQNLKREISAALADPEINGIMLDVDSHGGESAGCFALAEYIRSQSGTKPIYAHANESAYSAGYALFSAADRCYVSPDSGVGSIGVIMQHIDQSRYNANLGIQVNYIYAGQNKADGNPHNPLPPAVQEKLQDRVNHLRQRFAAMVDQHRGLEAGSALTTEAATYLGQEAVDLGLADAVATWDQALQELVDDITRPGLKPRRKGLSSATSRQKKPIQSTKSKATPATQAQGEEMPSELSTKDRLNLLISNNADAQEALAELGYVPTGDSSQALSAPNTEPDQASLEKHTATALEADHQKNLLLVEMCELSGRPEMLGHCLREKMSVDQARQALLNEQAIQSAQSAIRSTLTSESRPEAVSRLQELCRSAGQV